MEENKKPKVKLIICLILVIALIIVSIFFIFKIHFKEEISKTSNSNENVNPVNIQTEEYKEIINRLSNFDLDFLKIENKEENKIYSPLSIKYGLKMLEEGATGNSKDQISKLLGQYDLTKYKSNENMSIANSLFVNSLLKNDIKNDYIKKVKSNYDAEIIFDYFSDAKNINSWVNDKTLKLINNIATDEDVRNSKFILINALGIDMEWKNKFLDYRNSIKDPLVQAHCTYSHENFLWEATENGLSSQKFGKKNTIVSGMEIVASINNYDIVTELGEDNIIKTVSEAYKEYAKDDKIYHDEPEFNENVTDEIIEEKLNEFLYGRKNNNGEKITEGYLKELDSNYGKYAASTDFSVYVDDNVKAFSKDLKEYNGTTLQYIGIMPKTENLEEFVENTNDDKINNIIDNLKEIKPENFKSGVVTRIFGFIPKFKFEYEIDLIEDLKKLGITDIFEEGKANILEITENESDYIKKAIHKANIEFTQDGIKAAAATMETGWR